MDVTAGADRKRKIEGHFKVDPSVGRNLKLKVFNLEKREIIGSMELTGPNGQSSSLIQYDGSTATVSIALAQTGEWHFSIQLVGTQLDPLKVTVTSHLMPDTTAPLTTKCWVQNGNAKFAKLNSYS